MKKVEMSLVRDGCSYTISGDDLTAALTIDGSTIDLTGMFADLLALGDVRRRGLTDIGQTEGVEFGVLEYPDDITVVRTDVRSGEVVDVDVEHVGDLACAGIVEILERAVGRSH